MVRVFYSFLKTSAIVFGLALFFSSCIPQKEIVLLQPENSITNKSEFTHAPFEDYRFNYGDNAYINIKSLDEQSNEIFNPNSRNSNQATQNDAGIYLNSYTIDSNGEINFPLIGKIKLVGLTQHEAIDKIQTAVDVYIKETTVVVKLVNFNVTILGEVKRPGEFKIYQDKLNILEAIALAGDMTEYGNKKAIKLMRLTNTGREMVLIDLTKESVLESPYFFLKPNDIIYVAPMSAKQFGFASFPYTLLFATISSVILILSYIK
jgi:polysaccharide export outer membrane protein